MAGVRLNASHRIWLPKKQNRMCIIIHQELQIRVQLRCLNMQIRTGFRKMYFVVT